MTLSAACGSADPGPLIVIDGEFADWDLVPPALVDPFENGPGAVDFGEIRVESDGDAVYFAIDFGRTVNPQAMQGTVSLALDVDDDPATGTAGDAVLEGADLTIVFSPMREPDRPVGQGVGVYRPGVTEPEDAYGIGLQFAPTYASRYTEIRLDRAAFSGDSFRGRLVYRVASDELADQTASFEVPLRAGSPNRSLRADADAIERASGTTFRVLAWNVSDRGPLEEPDAFGRLVALLDPDVILFDEVSPDIDAAWFAQRFEPLSGEWTILRGRAGGRQTTLVAGRLPLEPALERIDYPDSVAALIGRTSTPQLQQDLATAAEDALPALGVVADVDGARILLITTDLQCCGHAGSTEDRARSIMADAIRGAAATVVQAGGLDGVVIAGDFNLVGSRTPLDRIAAGLDPDGGDLLPVAALRLNGVSMATWRSPGPFPPGRLDFVLHSPSSLEPVRAFAFEVGDLETAAVRSLGLQDGDGRAVSDHLPLVVDFVVR